MTLRGTLLLAAALGLAPWRAAGQEPASNPAAPSAPVLPAMPGSAPVDSAPVPGPNVPSSEPAPPPPAGLPSALSVSQSTPAGANYYSLPPPPANPGKDGSAPVEAPKFTVDFKDGVLFKTNDSLFSLRINNLPQVDYRDFVHTAGDFHTPTSLQDNFTLAREWLYFRGNVTEYVDYQTVVASGAGASVTGPSTVNLLDAFLDFNPFGADVKEKFQFRVGRFRTPFLYQFFVLSPSEYIGPELSMFSTNYLQNRQLGSMAHGKLFDQRLYYAAGVFNGDPNSFEVTFSNREWIGFLAYSPFLKEEGNPFKNLTLVGCYAVGRQFGPTIPSSLGTAVPSAGPPLNALISPTFVTFVPTAIQNGSRTLWDVELLWAYKSFNFYAEYDAGNVAYGLTTNKALTVPVALSGWSATATYFFTGEEINLTRRRIEPRRPYSWKCRTFGALEGFARYSNFIMSDNVKTNQIADAGSANGVNATDIGVNWYLNPYVRIVFDWQHAMFNSPVTLSPTRAINTEDMFWTRFQLYY